MPDAACLMALLLDTSPSNTAMPDLPAAPRALPHFLAERARTVRLGPTGIPAMIAHPNWTTPAPVVLWLHGRTAHKELDPGRFLRWLRAGLAICSIDLPGHGERLDPEFQHPRRLLDLLEIAVGEIDGVVAALRDLPGRAALDLDRLAIGGMSAGGMAVLRRLCDPHPFRAVAVEGTSGSLAEVWSSAERGPTAAPDADRLARLDPIRHVVGWRPVPFLAMHSEADRLVPIIGIRRFVAALRPVYEGAGAIPDQLRLVTWPTTGAPDEHLGFGRFSNEAKNIQTEFFRGSLRENRR